MKKLTIFPLFLFILANVSGQITLTYHNNCPVPGDSTRLLEIINPGPGGTGENQVWDFSVIQFTGKINYSGVTENSAVKSTQPGEKSLKLSDEGYVYSYLADEHGYREIGYDNDGKKLSLTYSQPVIRMQFPMAYGDRFTNPFTGVAYQGKTNKIEVGGNYTVQADAYGTLILPDRILKNTLRVKTSKQYLQTNMCGSTQSNIVKYCWFAAGYRYPVLTLTTTENSYSGKIPVVTKTGWLNLNQQNGQLAGNGNQQASTRENSVIVFPNPFTEQLSYNYFLRAQVPVTVELYDMSGQFDRKIESKQIQSEGLHSGILNATTLGLTPGVYYLRFTFDKQVIVNKIVKI